MTQKLSKCSSCKGFSLIEVMISLFVLVTGLLATIELVTGSINQTISSRDALIAGALAQEGIELVRNVRDNTAAGKYYEDPPDDDIFANFPSGTAERRIDYNSVHRWIGDQEHSPPTGIAPISSGPFALNLVDYNSNDKLMYEHRDGVTTPFQRKIIFSEPEFDVVNVTSMVTWNNEDVASKTISTCSKAQSCVFDTTVFTGWILH